MVLTRSLPKWIRKLLSCFVFPQWQGKYKSICQICCSCCLCRMHLGIMIDKDVKRCFGLVVWLKSWMLRGKAKVSHTRNEKLILCLKLLFTQAYVKIIQSVCTHSWIVGVFFATSQGVGTQIAKGMLKFMQVFLVVLSVFLSAPAALVVTGEVVRNL